MTPLGCFLPELPQLMWLRVRGRGHVPNPHICAPKGHLMATGDVMPEPVYSG